MNAAPRPLRRAALLMFPQHSLHDQVLDRIVEEGFTDVGVGVVRTPHTKGQGFDLGQSARLAEMCKARGLGFIAFTGYMKYHEAVLAREPQRMMLLAARGRVMDLDSLPVRWLCPFRPENKKDYLSLLQEVCRWPALREIHLNDEASLGFDRGVIGCYCDYCREEFRKAAGAEPPTAANWDDPLWYAWIESRLERWTAVHAELRAAIKTVRPDVCVGIQHSPYTTERVCNAWQSGICLARDAQALDLITTDPYHFLHDDRIRHRPHRRVLSETTRSLVGACARRLTMIYPQGFMPPSLAVPMGRQDGVLAGVVPFALGANEIMPFTYDLMRIIPGFFEGFQDTRRLLPHFESHAPYAFATMLMPQQSEIYGHPESNWGATQLGVMVDMMYRTGLPWRWFWDQRLDDAGEDLHGPLILPETHCLTQPQLDRIAAVVDRGEGAFWIGNKPRGPWAGRGECKLPAPVRGGVFRAELSPGHPLTDGLDAPLVLGTCMDGPAPEGAVLATVEGKPVLVAREDGRRREVWLAGMPVVNYSGTIPGGWATEPTANVPILRRILTWLSSHPPLMRLDPFPPVDDYSTLRPTDPRAVPTIELLPMVSDDSLLAVIFPYTPVGCETSLVIVCPPGRHVGPVKELWRDEDWTERVRHAAGGTSRIPLRLPGDCEVVALLIRLDRN